MKTISSAIRHAIRDFSNKNQAMDPSGLVANPEKFINFVVDHKREDRGGRVADTKHGFVLTTHKRSVHAGLLSYLKNRGKDRQDIGGVLLDPQREHFVFAQKSIAEPFLKHQDPSVRQAAEFILCVNPQRGPENWARQCFRITPELREANLVLRRALREQAAAEQQAPAQQQAIA